MMLVNKCDLKTPQDVDNAAVALSDVWNKHFPPAPSINGKKKNKLRDMICEMAGYNGGYQTFIKSLEDTPEPMNIHIGDYDQGYLVTIGDCRMDYDDTFNRCDGHYANWRLREVDEHVELLLTGLSEVGAGGPPSDSEMLKQTIMRLMGLPDTYIWVSENNTFDIVAASQDVVKFNEICEETLEFKASLPVNEPHE